MTAQGTTGTTSLGACLEAAHALRLADVGRLAAGVAHEINTPIQFIGDSVHFLEDAARDLFRLVERHRALLDAVASGLPIAELATRVAAAERDADLEYLEAHVPAAFRRAVDGLESVSSIVRSLKEFAHPDGNEKTMVDLNRAVQSTLLVARNEYKYIADVELILGELLPVPCHAGDLNQAILNLLLNAAHAIADSVQRTGERGRLTITTRHGREDEVELLIADTGGGIPESIRARVFEPFFTTKEVGRGTGQGLAIARAVVVEKHGGRLWFECVEGHGTTFHLCLPVSDATTAREPEDESER